MDSTTRKQQRLERTRRDILEAAARAFAARGLVGATMEDVAQEAGYSVGSLYNYFDSKDDIYQSLIDRVMLDFLALHDDPAMPTLPFRARLEWLLRRVFAMVEDRREFFVMFLAQRAALHGDLADEVVRGSRQAYFRWVDRMEAFVREGVTEGVLRDADSRDAAYFVVGVINAAVFRRVGGDCDGPLTDRTGALLDLILRGIGAGGTGDPP